MFLIGRKEFFLNIRNKFFMCFYLKITDIKLHLMIIKCFYIYCIYHIDMECHDLIRVRNEEVRRRAGIERELESRADQRVLRWIGM